MIVHRHENHLRRSVISGSGARPWLEKQLT
jgi:hypothetical protein